MSLQELAHGRWSASLHLDLIEDEEPIPRCHGNSPHSILHNCAGGRFASGLDGSGGQHLELLSPPRCVGARPGLVGPSPCAKGGLPRRSNPVSRLLSSLSAWWSPAHRLGAWAGALPLSHRGSVSTSSCAPRANRRRVRMEAVSSSLTSTRRCARMGPVSMPSSSSMSVTPVYVVSFKDGRRDRRWPPAPRQQRGMHVQAPQRRCLEYPSGQQGAVRGHHDDAGGKRR